MHTKRAQEPSCSSRGQHVSASVRSSAWCVLPASSHPSPCSWCVAVIPAQGALCADVRFRRGKVNVALPETGSRPSSSEESKQSSASSGRARASSGAAPDPKRPFTTRAVTVKQSAGHAHTHEQSFRELIANAYDEHVLANLPPTDVVFEDHLEDAQPMALVWNQGAPIVEANFSIEKSKKTAFVLDDFTSCIGCFGEGMSEATASLASLHYDLVFQTSTSVIVIVSATPSHAHPRRCDAAAARVIQGFPPAAHDGNAVLARDNKHLLTPAGPAGTQQAVDAHKVELQTHEYSFSDASISGTKLYILFPPGDSQGPEAWRRARASFLHYHRSASPLLELYSVSPVKQPLPVLQVFSKVRVPTDLFEEEPDANSEAEDEGKFDFIFLNGMAYRVAGISLYFAFNFLMQPLLHAAEIAAVAKVRRVISSKRQVLTWDVIGNLMRSCFPTKKNSHSATLRHSLAMTGVVDGLAEVSAALTLDPHANMTSKLETLEHRLSQQARSGHILARPALVSFIHTFESPPSSKFNDLSSSAVSSIVDVLATTKQEIVRRTLQIVNASTSIQDQLMQVARDAETAAASEGINIQLAEDDLADEDETMECAAPPPDSGCHRRRSSNAPVLQKLERMMPLLSDEKQKPFLAALNRAVETSVRIEQANAQQPKVVINVRVSSGPTAEHKKFLADVQAQAPGLDWDMSVLPDPYSKQNFTATSVLVDVLSALFKQGTGVAFNQMVADLMDSSFSPTERAARRALLFVMCRILRAVGRGSVNVRLSPRKQPLLTGPTTEAGVAAPDGEYELEVPYLGIQPSSKDSVGILLPSDTLLACLREVTRVKATSVTSIGAEYQASQAMLLRLVEPHLLMISPSSKSNATSAFRIVTNAGEGTSILVLIDRWGRQFGGVPTFNMAFCKALASDCVWGAGAERREIWVTCVAADIVIGKQELAAHPRLRIISAPHPLGVNDAIARLHLVSRACLWQQSSLPGWPVAVDLVVGHDRFSGQVAADVAARFQALFVVFAHTNPLAIGGTKTETYGAQAKDTLLKDSLKSADQAFGCGNTKDRFGGLHFKHADHAILGFHGGYIAPSNASNSLWMGMTSSTSVSLVILGRLEEKLKNTEQVDFIVKQLNDSLSAKGHYSSIFIGVDPEGNETDEADNSMHNSTKQPYLTDEASVFETMRPGLCLLLPSLVESYGLVAVEALGIGQPIIVSNRSGLGHRLLHLAEYPADWVDQNGVDWVDQDGARKLTPAQALLKLQELVKLIVLEVKVDGAFPTAKWAAALQWIEQQTRAKTMQQWVTLLKAALGSWKTSVQKQFCDVLAESSLFKNQAARLALLSKESLWIDC